MQTVSQTITATDLARHTRKILDRVASQGESVIVERNHVVVARIVPSEATMTAAQALAGVQTMLTAAQVAAWLAESRKAFDENLRDPWA